MAHEFVTAYGPKTDVVNNTEGESMTKQSFTQECDINFIIRQYDRTGVVSHLNQTQGRYADLTGLDFKTMSDQVAAARSQFELLDAHVRAEFENSPAKFLDFIHDAKNHERAVELGLAYPKEGEPDPLRVRIIPEPVEPAPKEG